MMTSLTGVGAGYAGDARAVSNVTSAPREIGWLERLSGLNNGLSEIEGRLSQFRERLSGVASDRNHPAAQTGPVGVDGTLSEAEQRIRNILGVLGEINGAF